MDTTQIGTPRFAIFGAAVLSKGSSSRQGSHQLANAVTITPLFPLRRMRSISSSPATTGNGEASSARGPTGAPVATLGGISVALGGGGAAFGRGRIGASRGADARPSFSLREQALRQSARSADRTSQVTRIGQNA